MLKGCQQQTKAFYTELAKAFQILTFRKTPFRYLGEGSYGDWTVARERCLIHSKKLLGIMKRSLNQHSSHLGFCPGFAMKQLCNSDKPLKLWAPKSFLKLDNLQSLFQFQHFIIYMIQRFLVSMTPVATIIASLAIKHPN